MTNYLAKVTKWLGYLIALLVIIAATLVSVGRLLTPYLNQHKPDFENWASQLLNAPVNIGQVHISWNGYAPQLTLDKVTILDKNTNKPTFDIRQIKINGKILESLIKLEPISSYIKITGMDLTIRSKKSGALNVVGFGDIAITDNLLGGAHEANEVVAWIFSQPALALSDIHVTFFTRAGIKKSITLDELSLLNSNTTHLLSGKGSLNQDIPTGVELSVDWQGDHFDLETVSAKLYLYLEGISLPQWFKQQTWKNLQIKEGLGSAKIWLDWDKGQFQKIQTQLQLYHLNIYSLTTRQSQFISRLNGNFGWRRDGKNQIIAGNDILIDLPHHLWPTTSFSLTLPLPHEEVTLPASVPMLALQLPSKFDSFGFDNHVATFNMTPSIKEDPFSLRMSYVDLADMCSFALSSGLLPNELESKIISLKPRGEVAAIKFDFQDSVHLENNSIAGEFTGLSWIGWEKYPGISALSGVFEWNGKKGSLVLDSKDMQLTYPTFFSNPVFLGNVTGRMEFQKDKKDTWILYSKNFDFSNDDLHANIKATVGIPKGESPLVDLVSNITMKKASHFIRYFPLKKADPDLSRWLLQAFHGGKFVSGKLIIQGRVSDFPFGNQNGKFSMSADAEDLDFGYAPGWPSMKHVYGTIQFISHKMLFDIKSGLLQDIPVKNLHGEIPYIGPHEPQVLMLNGVIDGNLTQGMQLIQQSPLKNKLSKEVSALQISGPMQLKLSVSIPLKKPENSVVIGDMTISQGTLSMPAWNMNMGNLNGMLHFTEKSVEANNVTGMLWGEPVAIQVNTQAPHVKIKMQGQLTESVLDSFLINTPLANTIKGGTIYQAELQLVIDQLSQPVQLIIDTDLKGIALDLPMGLGKKANEVIPSKIIANLKQNKPLEIKWIYGNKLSAATTIKNSKAGMEFYSAELRLGNKGEASFQAQPGLLISGQFGTFDWHAWKTYFSGLSMMESNKSANVLFNLFRSIDIRAHKIIGLFQNITNAHVQLTKTQNDYTLKIESTEITGVITVPIQTKQGVIQANFSHLYLSSRMIKPDLLDPKLLPAISFVGNDVRYQDKKLGRVSFDVSPIKNGLDIESLRLESDIFNLTASGEWLSQNKKVQTSLKGKLTTKNVAEFLSNWGSPTANPVGSSGDVLFDLSWPDSPYSPVLSSMSGRVDLALTAGHIVNLDQATNAKMGFGRILNLLSLDSISRALTFNFSDLTEKGYSFDSMKGRFTLKDGNAFTDNVRMDGSIARIEMSGRLGLAAKDYDIKLSVTPFVTGSIPVVAALAVNPIVGIAVWAVEKVAGKAVSSATTHDYEVTGTWDKPVWVDK